MTQAIQGHLSAIHMVVQIFFLCLHPFVVSRPKPELRLDPGNCFHFCLQRIWIYYPLAIAWSEVTNLEPKWGRRKWGKSPQNITQKPWHTWVFPIFSSVMWRTQNKGRGLAIPWSDIFSRIKEWEPQIVGEAIESSATTIRTPWRMNGKKDSFPAPLFDLTFSVFSTFLGFLSSVDSQLRLDYLSLVPLLELNLILRKGWEEHKMTPKAVPFPFWSHSHIHQGMNFLTSRFWELQSLPLLLLSRICSLFL